MKHLVDCLIESACACTCLDSVGPRERPVVMNNHDVQLATSFDRCSTSDCSMLGLSAELLQLGPVAMADSVGIKILRWRLPNQSSTATRVRPGALSDLDPS